MDANQTQNKMASVSTSVKSQTKGGLAEFQALLKAYIH